jgi:hypothetical protein
MFLLKNLTQLNWVNIQIIVKRCDQDVVLPLLITYEVLWLQIKNKVGLGFEPTSWFDIIILGIRSVLLNSLHPEFVSLYSDNRYSMVTLRCHKH